MVWLNDLFAWHQDFYKEFLDDGEYQRLFELTKAETDDALAEVGLPPPEISIVNPVATPSEIYDRVPEDTLSALIGVRKESLRALQDIDAGLADGSLTAEEAQRVADEAVETYIQGVNEILTEDQSRLIFGEDRLTMTQ